MIMEKTGAIGFITQTRFGCVFQQKPLKSSAVVVCLVCFFNYSFTSWFDNMFQGDLLFYRKRSSSVKSNKLRRTLKECFSKFCI